MKMYEYPEKEGNLCIYPEFQLGDHSREVEICRADAKGTGELPDYMEE